jgi:[protein-PII] uridylyltransferase
VDNIKNIPTHIIDEQEYRIFRIALEFLFRVRSALHLVTGKKEDKLRLELIPHVACLLGYKEGARGQMLCAKKVTESLKIIRLYSRIWLSALTKNYTIVPQDKHFIYPQETQHHFHALLGQLVAYAQKPFYTHPSFLQALIGAEKPQRLNSELYRIIKEIFYQPYSYSIFNALSHARLLGYTIPAMKKIIDLPQFDGYHQYAVDIHSMRCIYYLEHIEDPFIRGLFDALSTDEKVMLKIVTFLHDAGKGRRRDHHFVGASLFKAFAQKVKMKKELIVQGETLILYHTLMSKTAQREDLYNEKNILHFASHFQSKKLLDLIYILTYADMNGVGDGIYNAFTAKLIKTLYNQSVEILDQTGMLDEATKRLKKEETLKKNVVFTTLTQAEQKKILNIPSDLLFMRYSPLSIVELAKKAFQTKEYRFEIHNEDYLTIEVIRAKSFNVSYLLGKLPMLEVVNMDICKLFDGLKYFKIEFSDKVTLDDIRQIEEILHNSFDGSKESTLRVPLIEKEELHIDCEYSKAYAIMQLQCKNQKGLLAYIIHIFDAMGIDIATAKIHTIKNRAKDMFLIEKNGNFCNNTQEIIDKLTKGTKCVES